MGKDGTMRKSAVIVAVLSITLLAGCGRREPERAEGGAAAGAATGAAVGLVGGPVGVVAGGAIGAVAGGSAGAGTKPKDVNLGSPPWHDNTQTGQKAAQHLAN
jgi:phage tail tape-measure protein